jgi:ATP-binding cassette subfamily C protein CydCD
VNERLEGGLGPGGLGTLYRLGLISAGKGLALVVLGGAIADGIAGVAGGTDAWRPAIGWGIAAAVARAALSWAGNVAATRAALGAKQALRGQLAERLVSGGPAPVGSSTSLGVLGLDELDDYYRKVLPAVMNAAVIPLLVGARILFADWISAGVIVLTVPLIPVFMVLVGKYTSASVAESTTALGRLSNHLVELARGLPVLVGLGRVEEQSAALERISEEYRTATMRTLRIAFLSSLVLELIATISVAVVAVFVGLRLISGDLPLAAGLLALVLAPECYAPFREVGTAFHASQNGLAALRLTKGILAAPLLPSLREGGDRMAVHGLTVRYGGRSEAAVDALGFAIEAGQATALVGQSGSGKSSVLAVLAGLLVDGTDDARVTGRVVGIDAARVAFAPQHPNFAGATVREELEFYAVGAPVTQVAVRVVAFGLTGLLDDDPSQLSPGEQRRVAVARALLRVDAGADILLLDEPTAHLDAANAGVVEEEILRLRGTVTVVFASHDSGMSAVATRRVRLGSADTIPAARQEQTDAVVDTRPSVAAPSSAPGPAIRLLRDFLRPSRGRFAAAVLLGVAATLFGVSLTAVSGWLIVRASEHAEIMFLLVAIVGVRFFGIGRAVLRYGEQLATHDAIFRSLGALRQRVWAALASHGASSRKLLRGGTAMDYLVLTTDRARDLAPRVVVPALIGAVTGIAAIVGVALLHAPAVPIIVGCLAICLVVAPPVALWADRAASRDTAALGSEVGRRFAALVGAASDLRANGVDGEVRSRLAAVDREASASASRGARALGLGHAIVVLTCCGTAILMLLVVRPAVEAHTLPGEMVAVLVLLPLALLEPMLGVIDAVQQWPTLADALRSLDLAGPTARSERRAPAAPATGDMLQLDGVAARWPDSERPAFSDLTASANEGDWLVVQGPSGSGKSTLLTLLLGYLHPDSGTYRLGGADSRDLERPDIQKRIAWAPQEGHLFDSTLRGNLLLARSREDAPGDDELEAALVRVGLGPLLDELPDRLDTRVGPQGSHLSGGQRQRVSVARTLLTRAEVVLLDEPTAHLDREGAEALLADLRDATRKQTTVLVTHRFDDIREGDQVITLGGGQAMSVPPSTGTTVPVENPWSIR